MKPEAPNLNCRIALRLPEAAAVLGISESTLRRALPELDNCVLRLNGSVLLSVEALRRRIDQMAQEQDQQAAADADAVLCDIEI